VTVHGELVCNLMQELNMLLLLCRQRRPTLCRCQTCVVTILMLLVLLSMSVSAGLIVTYLQLRKELDVVRNRLVTGAVSNSTPELSCNLWYVLSYTHQICSFKLLKYFSTILC